MLPKLYRFHIVNNTGETATYDDGARLSLRIMQWKFNSSGVLVYNPSVVVVDFSFGGSGVFLNGTSEETDNFDNSSDLFLGLNGVLIATHDLDAALGRWDLFIEGTDDVSFFVSETDDFDIEQDAKFIDSLRVDNNGVDRSTGMDFSYE